jgi:hypothetical protein
MNNSLASTIMKRGFAVLPSFLDEETVGVFAADYKNGRHLDNKMYTLGFATPDLVASLNPKIEEISTQLKLSEELKVNHIGGGAFFATENGIDFDWHQDHESYFIHQTHRNYLNLYIQVIKPERTRTNLSVIPIDNFKRRSPDVWGKLEWGGASGARVNSGKTAISDDCHGGIHGTLDYDIEALAETPELFAGDALLLRGDIFHRTQDTETPRVALSIRMWDNAITVTSDHFNRTCPTKNWFMEKNEPMYDRLRKVFEQHESLPLVQLMQEAYSN